MDHFNFNLSGALMDGQTLFNIGISIAAGLGIPLLTFFWNRIKESKEESMKLAQEAKDIALNALQRHNAFELTVTKEYVSMQHFEKFEQRLFGELETIKDKLDNKADKP